MVEHVPWYMCGHVRGNAPIRNSPREFGKSLEEWNFEQGLLLHRGKVYVPKDQSL